MTDRFDELAITLVNRLNSGEEFRFTHEAVADLLRRVDREAREECLRNRPRRSRTMNIPAFDLLAKQRDEARIAVLYLYVEVLRTGSALDATGVPYEHIKKVQEMLIAWGLVKPEECVRP